MTASARREREITDVLMALREGEELAAIPVLILSMRDREEDIVRGLRQGADDYVGLALKCGEVNLRAMELLDAGNTGHFGHPEPSIVSLGHKAGKAILVTGHDLKDIENLLSLETVGVTGVITGKALYSGSLDLKAAIALTEGPV